MCFWYRHHVIYLKTPMSLIEFSQETMSYHHRLHGEYFETSILRSPEPVKTIKKMAVEIRVHFKLSFNTMAVAIVVRFSPNLTHNSHWRNRLKGLSIKTTFYFLEKDG